jgi:hypothetical protein
LFVGIPITRLNWPTTNTARDRNTVFKCIAVWSQSARRPRHRGRLLP